MEDEERKRKEEEEENKRREEEKREKELMTQSPEQIRKNEEERFKKEEENLISGIKDRIDAAKKYQENREQQLQMEKEKQDNDENRWKSNQKLGVNYHTQKEIKLFSKEALDLYSSPVEYDIQPKITVPYNPGKITKQTFDNSLKYFNSLRYAAGLSHNIEVTEEYNKLAQDASLLMAVNNKMAHSGQPKPKNMSQDLYDSGAKGWAKSNIGNGYANLQNAIKGWISDDDENNFDRVGHRRWVLNPTMKNTGLGLLESYSSNVFF